MEKAETPLLSSKQHARNTPARATQKVGWPETTQPVLLPDFSGGCKRCFGREPKHPDLERRMVLGGSVPSFGHGPSMRGINASFGFGFGGSRLLKIAGFTCVSANKMRCVAIIERSLSGESTSNEASTPSLLPFRKVGARDHKVRFDRISGTLTTAPFCVSWVPQTASILSPTAVSASHIIGPTATTTTTSHFNWR